MLQRVQVWGLGLVFSSVVEVQQDSSPECLQLTCERELQQRGSNKILHTYSQGFAENSTIEVGHFAPLLGTCIHPHIPITSIWRGDLQGELVVAPRS